MRREAWAWCSYDFANTIFSMVVVSLTFPLYLNTLSGRDAPAGWANSLSMLAAALTVPLAGILADRTGRGRRFLFQTTLLCCVFTAFLGCGERIWTLVLAFAVANYFYQIGLVFYNSLLTAVSSPRQRGKVSGWGVSLGYLGSICGLLVAGVIQNRYGLPAVFYAAAVLFFFTALPIFFLVPSVRREKPITWSALVDGWAQVIRTLSTVWRARRSRNFFLAKFFYTEAMNTIIVFMSVYAVRAVGFDMGEVKSVMIALTVSAVIGAVIIGRLVDSLGASRVLLGIVLLWALVIIGLIFLPGKAAFYMLGSLAGALLGGVWTSDRVVLISLAPRGQLNEYFGLYGLVGKASAVFGPVTFGLTADAFGYAWAMGTVLVMLLCGLFFLLAFRRAGA